MSSLEKPHSYSLSYQISRSGEEVPILNGKPLHSLYDSTDEVSSFISKNLEKIKSAKFIIILGLGNGNYIKSLLEINSKINLLIIEPVKELVDKYLPNNSQIRVISSAEPCTVLTDEHLIYFVSQRAPIIIHPGSYQANKVFFERFLTHRFSDRSFSINGNRYQFENISIGKEKTDFLAACLKTMSDKATEAI